MWPTLGGGTILAVTPSQEEMTQVSEPAQTHCAALVQQLVHMHISLQQQRPTVHTCGQQLTGWRCVACVVCACVPPQRLGASRAVTSEDLRKQKEANTATIDSMMKQFAHKQT